MKRKSFNDNKPTKKTAVTGIVSVIVILSLLLLVFGYFAANASTDKIYKGVYVGDVHLGGKTQADAQKIIEKEYKKFAINAKLSCDGTDFDLYATDAAIKLDSEATAKLASECGKEGSIFSKVGNMLSLKSNPQKLNVVLSYDEAILQNIINDKLSGVMVDVTDYTVEIGEDELIVTNGKDGKGVLAKDVIDAVADAYTNHRLDSRLEFKTKDIPCEKIDVKKFCEEYNREAKDAVCEEDGENINITPEVIGVKIDNDEAKKIIEANKNSTGSYYIPAIITYPEVTAKELEEEFTDCIIATYSSNYSTSTANRKENIRLASTKINGVILNPGEVFSFNGVVGPRTVETGYKMAHVYSGGKTVDGIGGGICQVSSTLYNAVVLADLEIVYRTNHTLPVSYVPLGRDATVSYGTIDFKFKNNKQSPIKLEVIADGVNLTVNVYGRKKYITDVSIETAVIGSIPYSTETIEDETMYEDEKVVVEKGANGTKVEAYKIVKKDGQVVSRTLLCKSTYTPSTEVVRIGTKKRDAEGGITGNPEEPVPETPGISDVPTVSDAPVVSDVPVVSEPPVVPDVPAVPETPVVPETPAVPEATAPEPVIMQ